jgi:ABC-type glycerol-3-phosphate transport system permease component
MSRKEKEREKVEKFMVTIILIAFTVISFISIISGIIYHEKNKTTLADRKHHSAEIVNHAFEKDSDKVTITLSDGVVFESYKSIFNDKNNYESNITIDKANIKNGNIITYIKNNDKFHEGEEQDTHYTILDVETPDYEH